MEALCSWAPAQQHPQHCQHHSWESACIWGHDRQTLRHFITAAPTQTLLPKRGRSLTAQACSDSHELSFYQPNGKWQKIPWMSKSPSAGSTFLKRLPTPAGKQPTGWGVCKATVAGGSCPVQLWGCPLQCSHCKMWSRRPSAPSAETVPSCILYALNCILKAGSDLSVMHCRAAVQVLLGRCEKPTEAEWHGTRFNSGASKVVPLVPRWAFTVQKDEWTLPAQP